MCNIGIWDNLHLYNFVPLMWLKRQGNHHVSGEQYLSESLYLCDSTRSHRVKGMALISLHGTGLESTIFFVTKVWSYSCKRWIFFEYWWKIFIHEKSLEVVAWGEKIKLLYGTLGKTH